MTEATNSELSFPQKSLLTETDKVKNMANIVRQLWDYIEPGETRTFILPVSNIIKVNGQRDSICIIVSRPTNYMEIS